MKHAIGARWLANPNLGRRHFAHGLWSSFEYIKPKMAIIYCERNLISLKNMSFWYKFLELPPYHMHLNIGVLRRKLSN